MMAEWSKALRSGRSLLRRRGFESHFWQNVFFLFSWLELGDYVKAEQLFDKSYQLNVQEPFNVWSEVQGGAGAANFITGAGGFLQSLIYGYTGLRIHPLYLEINPVDVLPPKTTKMTLKGFKYLNTKFDFSIESDFYSFKCLSHSEGEFVKIVTENDVIEFLCLDEPKVYEFPKQKLRLQSVSETNCEPPKDEINVPY